MLLSVLLAAAAPTAEGPPSAPSIAPLAAPVTDTLTADPAPEASPAPVVTDPSSPPRADTVSPVPDSPAPRSALGNEIVVSARVKTPADPLMQLNAKSFAVIESIDQAVVGPMALGYQKAVPSPLRSGLRNFLRNLDEPVSALNYVLQLKPGRAVKSTVRFALNTTVGIGGVIDVAKRKPFKLPYHPNGFANTLACYGVGPGPFFFLPIAGPITLRDLIGIGLDKAVIPAVAGRPFNSPYYAIPAISLDALTDRIEMDADLRKLREESNDPYVATRELYLQQRRAEIAAICPKQGDLPIDPKLPPRVGKGVD